MIGFDPADQAWSTPGRGIDPTYRGTAFLSAPILYPTPEGTARPVGVINLTDRLGTDAFTQGERRLVAAIAGQIAAAIENARLVDRDRQQLRLRLGRQARQTWAARFDVAVMVKEYERLYLELLG